MRSLVLPPHRLHAVVVVLGSASLGVAVAAATMEEDPSRTTAHPGPTSTLSRPPEPETRANGSGDAARVTAWDQSEDEEARTVTRSIRRALVDDDTLSFVAKNVLVVTTSDGTVTLQGLVRSAGERHAVVATARKLAGAGRVVDRLEVRGP